MSGPAASLSVVRQGDVNIIQIEDRCILEETVIKSITDQLWNYAYQDPNPKLLLDMQMVEQLSSAGLGMLISIDRLYKQRHGRFVLANVSARIREVLQITRFDGILNIQDSIEQAMAQLG